MMDFFPPQILLHNTTPCCGKFIHIKLIVILIDDFACPHVRAIVILILQMILPVHMSK